jgi:hypothetical protein
MHRLKMAVIVVAAVLGGIAPAMADDKRSGCAKRDRYCLDPDIVTTVSPQPASVTLSTALPKYASYEVTITHYARPETLAPVKFTATTSVVASDGVTPIAGQTADVVGSDSAECTASGVTVNCTFVAGLVAANSSKTFSVTVKAPSAGAQVKFASQTSWVEPNERNAPTEFEPERTAFTALDAPDPLKVSSFVPAGGGTLYTGENGGIPAPTALNTWTATVTLPPTAGSTTASIQNLISPITCAPNLLDCSSSTLTIPGGPFANLIITLRRDASTIGKYAKISNAKVFYTDPGHPNPSAVYPLQVPSCTDTTYGVLPLSGIPCMASRQAVYAPTTSSTSRTTSGGHDDDDDDHKTLLYWEFVIKAVDNGKYTN